MDYVKIGNISPQKSYDSFKARQFKESVSSDFHTSTDQFKKASDLSDVKSNGVLRSSLRDPAKAVTFINDFNSQLNLKPEDLSEKTKLMKEDAFAFYRAMPALFFHDLHGFYKSESMLLSSPAPSILICADSHPQNFGTLRSPAGNTVWGLNDYDQSGKGSPEWDLIRLAAGISLVSRKNGLDLNQEKQLLKKAADTYFHTIHEVYEKRINPPAWIEKNQTKNPVTEAVEKAEKQTQKEFLEKYTTKDKGIYKFKSSKRIVPLLPKEAEALSQGLQGYEKSIKEPSAISLPLRILDMAERTGSGGSSYGLKRYWVLAGASKPWREPVLLEIKELLPSPIDNQDADLQRADAAEIVRNQVLMGGLANPLTGSAVINGRSFMVREREPEKGAVSIEGLGFSEIMTLSEQTAKVLAFSHASGNNAEKLNRWIGKDALEAGQNLVKIAVSYANQVEADFETFKNS